MTMPRRMRQRDKHLARLLTMGANVVFHRRIAAGEPFFLAKPVVNPLRRVTLLLRDLQILQKPRINVARETIP